jgi:aryl-alcohol dehydrogenase-like predicted oxidoreductase
MESNIVIGGELSVPRLGFGALRLPPSNWEGSKAVARRAVELGVRLIDTADSYYLGLNEELLADALHPYQKDLVIATKAGQAHPGNDWIALGRPEYLRQQAELSLRRLRVETIDLYQLHRVDPKVPFEDQIGTLKRLRDEGKVRHVGLSNVSVDEIERARRIVPIVSVQNLYNHGDRRWEDVVDHCEREGIAFLPWLPVERNAAGGGPVARVAKRLGVSPVQAALAWLLHRSPVMLPIPGTSSIAHLEQNVAAAGIELSTEDLKLLGTRVASGV